MSAMEPTAPYRCQQSLRTEVSDCGRRVSFGGAEASPPSTSSAPGCRSCHGCCGRAHMATPWWLADPPQPPPEPTTTTHHTTTSSNNTPSSYPPIWCATAAPTAQTPPQQPLPPAARHSQPGQPYPTALPAKQTTGPQTLQASPWHSSGLLGRKGLQPQPYAAVTGGLRGDGGLQAQPYAAAADGLLEDGGLQPQPYAAAAGRMLGNAGLQAQPYVAAAAGGLLGNGKLQPQPYVGPAGGLTGHGGLQSQPYMAAAEQATVWGSSGAPTVQKPANQTAHPFQPPAPAMLPLPTAFIAPPAQRGSTCAVQPLLGGGDASATGRSQVTAAVAVHCHAAPVLVLVHG